MRACLVALSFFAFGCGSRSSVLGDALEVTAGPSTSGTTTAGAGGSPGSNSSAGPGTEGSVTTVGGSGPSTAGAGSGGTGPREPCSDLDGATAGPELVCIMGGTFTLGDAVVTYNIRENVEVRAFWLDETEVTVAQYRDCVNDGACSWPGQGSECTFTSMPGAFESHPINCVDLQQAETFCGWAGKRLPTEEEWEFAARGPGQTPRTFPWGEEEPTDQLCWDRTDGTCEVGSFALGNTPEGIKDMAGNVREFTSTCRSMDDAGCLHPAPGGSWISDTSFSFRAGNQWNQLPASHSTRVTGFRCAR